MIDKLFIDTGAFFSRELKSDQHHQVSIAEWQQIEDTSMRLYSSEHILNETMNMLARRASYALAAERGTMFLQSDECKWLQTSSEDLKTALTLMRKYADQAVSFTDCISFALMKREGIKYVFSFDRHFQAAQFRLWPTLNNR